MSTLFILTTVIALLALVIASVSDLKTREVPDWLSYGLIITALALRVVFFAVSFDWTVLINGLVGLAFFFVLACIMFYSGQWGGGDSKLLMGLGALFGIELKTLLALDLIIFLKTFPIAFLVNTLLAGAIYGLVWAVILAIKNRKAFVKELGKLRTRRVLLIRNGLVGLLLLTLFGMVMLQNYVEKLLLIVIFVAATLLYYFWLFTKAVEKSSMHKRISPEKLTEGDWVVNNIVVGRKHIAGPKDLGLQREQIDELIRLKKKKKIKCVLIKEGIPFVPSFLIGFVITLLVGNVVLLVL
jgi:Flp pilus assembly protein protease CpaA